MCLFKGSLLQQHGEEGTEEEELEEEEEVKEERARAKVCTKMRL
jgi:hypothetical protein